MAKSADTKRRHYRKLVQPERLEPRNAPSAIVPLGPIGDSVDSDLPDEFVVESDMEPEVGRRHRREGIHDAAAAPDAATVNASSDQAIFLPDSLLDNPLNRTVASPASAGLSSSLAPKASAIDLAVRLRFDPADKLAVSPELPLVQPGFAEPVTEEASESPEPTLPSTTPPAPNTSGGSGGGGGSGGTSTGGGSTVRSTGASSAVPGSTATTPPPAIAEPSAPSVPIAPPQDAPPPAGDIPPSDPPAKSEPVQDESTQAESTQEFAPVQAETHSSLPAVVPDVPLAEVPPLVVQAEASIAATAFAQVLQNQQQAIQSQLPTPTQSAPSELNPAQSNPSESNPTELISQFQSPTQSALSAEEAKFLIEESDVEKLLLRASAATANNDAIIAIVDRGGRILGVRVESGVVGNFTTGTPDDTLVFAIDGAVAKARTAAFFSNDAAALTSRTVRFISQTTITQREVESNPNSSDQTIKGPGFVAPIGLGSHFPPDIRFTPQVDLVAIEHTNRDSVVHPGVDRLKDVVTLAADGSVAGKNGDDILLRARFDAVFDTDQEIAAPESYGLVSNLKTDAQARGIATLPGGIPLYKNGSLVGGIGVFFPGENGFADFEQDFMHADERAALGLSPQTTKERTNAPKVLEAEFIALQVAANKETIGGIVPLEGYGIEVKRIDLVGITLETVGPHRGGIGLVNSVGRAIGEGTASGTEMRVTSDAGTVRLDGAKVPEEWLVSPRSSATLSAGEVREIIERGIDEANLVRSAIRLPLGSRSRMVLSVTDLDGNVLGLYRMPDATVFSIDVAVAKARNVAYYADAAALQPADYVDTNNDGSPDVAPGVAFTNRTFRFLSTAFFPSGIEGNNGGDFSILKDPGVNPLTAENTGAPVNADQHQSVLGFDAFNPGSNFREPVSGQQNGIVFFPGSTPLYRDGVLVGGLGISGDGVDQDDVVTFSAAGPFLPRGANQAGVLRADQVFVDGVRLPFQKFLRNPRG